MHEKKQSNVCLWIIFHVIIIASLQNADISHSYKKNYSYTVNGMFQLWHTNVGAQYCT